MITRRLRRCPPLAPPLVARPTGPSRTWPRPTPARPGAGPLTARQRPSAASSSLNTIASPASLLPRPLVMQVLARTGEKVASMGFVVRRCSQCSVNVRLSGLMTGCSVLRVRSSAAGRDAPQPVGRGSDLGGGAEPAGAGGRRRRPGTVVRRSSVRSSEMAPGRGSQCRSARCSPRTAQRSSPRLTAGRCRSTRRRWPALTSPRCWLPPPTPRRPSGRLPTRWPRLSPTAASTWSRWASDQPG
jgi:hypothetical protein